MRFHIIQSNSIPLLVSPYLPTPSLFHPPTKERKVTKQVNKSENKRPNKLKQNKNHTQNRTISASSLLALHHLFIHLDGIGGFSVSYGISWTGNCEAVRLVMFNSTCFEARLPRFTGPVALFGGRVFDSQHPHAAHNHLWLQSQASSTFFWPHWPLGLHVVHRHRCRQNLQKSFFPPHRLRMRMEWIIVRKSGEPAWSVCVC